MKRRHFLATTGAFALHGRLSAAAPALPSYLADYKEAFVKDPRAAAIQWFREANFGLFLHYGLYSLEGDHEWLQLPSPSE